MHAAHGSEVALRVRYAETDQMGRAYYGAYFAWFEVGRVELLRGLGATYAELEREGCLLPVVEARARYLAPARYDEEVLVRTELVSSGPSRMEFSSEVVSKEGARPIAEGRVVLACMGPDGRPRRMPPELRARVDEAAHAGARARPRARGNGGPQ
ncbi:MAG: acyl-CoA thioesterase [Planctomycetota bacterium]|jgi:acyl-CoA thioester hydrolase